MAAIYHDDRLFLLTAALGIKPLFAGISSPRYVVLAKTLNFRVVTLLEAMAAAAQVLASVGVAYFTHSYWAIAAGLLVASMVGLVTSYTSAPCWPRFSLASWRKLMSFSSWMTLNQIASVVGTRFDTFMGGGILGTAAFGAYNLGSNLASLVTQSAMEPLERVLFPSFATIAHDRPRLRSAFQRSQACLLAFGLPLGIGMALVADPFVYLALGPKWGIAAEVIHYIAPVLALQIVFGPQTALAYALGATRMVFTRSLVMLIIRVPIVFAGLWWWGLTGLLVSRVISGGFMMSIVNMYMINSLIGLSLWEQIRVAWRSLLSSGAMAVAVLLVATTFPPLRTAQGAFAELVVLVALGAVTYCGTHAALWLLTGRPDGGVEVELTRILGRLISRFNRQRQPAE